MNIHDATEAAYKRGYEDGKRDAVKHGRWVWAPANECWICDNCYFAALNNYRGLSVNSNYCPHCGAKMDGGNEDG